MRKFLATLLLGATLAFPAPAQNAAQPQEFRVVNRAGVPAAALHAVRSPRGATGDWGPNLLRPDRPLPDGAGFRVTPSGEAGCRFDLRLVATDGREAVLRDQDICVNRDLAIARLAAAMAPPAPRMAGPASAQVPLVEPNRRAQRVSTGTGFLIADARVMTNQHVIDGCNRIILHTPSGQWLAAAPPARADVQLDLAILNVPGLVGPTLAFREAPNLRRGESVVAYGFPLAGLLSSEPKLTRGEVNGLRGLRDNPNQFQISAAVQPGNSGGPLLDMQGHLVGVIVSKLNAQRLVQSTGDIAQNVNFAVQGRTALEFARRAGITPQLAESRGPELSTADVGDLAHRSTLFIRCER
jgi:serine protease Do